MKPGLPLTSSGRRTKIEKLLHVLSDGKWHSTRELVRRVGHTFSVAKFKLVQYGYPVQRQKHHNRKYQHLYRLPELPTE
jgi:hypothetical protein